MKSGKKRLLTALFVMTFSVPYSFSLWAKDDYKLPSRTIESGVTTAATDANVELLRKIQDGLTGVVAKVKNAVVFISISKSVEVPQYHFLDPFEQFFGMRQFRNPYGPQQNPHRPGEEKNHSRGPKQRKKKFEQRGVGSGFIIDNSKGYILTNNHVVGEADEITVQTYDGTKYQAKVVGTDDKTDVAIIQVKNLPAELGQIALTDTQDVKPGQWAIAVGAPHGLDQSVTWGIVSAKGRGSLQLTGYGDFIQTDAAINPGNSGGPLLNIDGEAMGMNTAIFSQSGGSQGIGFAIPAPILKEVALRLINDGRIQRAFLGVLIQDLTEELSKAFEAKNIHGVVISSVDPKGPAAKAGLKEGDIITKLGDVEMRSAEKLSYVVGMSAPGKVVSIEFFRKGKMKKTEVTLQEREEDKKAEGESRGERGKIEQADEEKIADDWGVKLEKVSPEHQLPLEKGLVVMAVEEGSAAEKAGLSEGDVIIEVNQEKVQSLADFKKQSTKDILLLRVARGAFFTYITLKK